VKFIPLSLIIILLAGCSRESGFLEKVNNPVGQTPQSQPSPGPQVPPKPGQPTPIPKLYSKVLEIKIANTQTTIPSVNILWVIDNSGSMAEERQSVIDNTDRFMRTFTSQTLLKWNMGLISTDVAQPPFIGFTPETRVDNTTADPVPKFQNAVRALSAGGSDFEEMFRPVLNSLNNYPGFNDPRAILAIIVLTDEDESQGKSSAVPSPADFVTQLAALKGGDKSKIVAYGVLQTGADCFSGFPYTFSRYWDFMRRVNSKRYPLCDPNFGNLLTSISEDLITRVSTLDPIILLEAKPIPSTIRVTYKGQVLSPGFKEEGGQWIYDPKYNYIKITNPALLDAGDRNILVEFTIDPKTY
jgi:hypothetical protein